LRQLLDQAGHLTLFPFQDFEEMVTLTGTNVAIADQPDRSSNREQ